jgi:hypothetical protein
MKLLVIPFKRLLWLLLLHNLAMGQIAPTATVG